VRIWTGPSVSVIPGKGDVPLIHNDITGVKELSAAGEVAKLYVCGITPYDATHLGHAATYLAFDLLVRAWRDAGLTVQYAQCLTDIDEPLLERARVMGLDWSTIAAGQTNLFRSDMAALRVIPPDFYRGVIETIPAIVRGVETLLDRGWAYRVPVSGAVAGALGDVYADLSMDPGFGSLTQLAEHTMDRLFEERGGDPERCGKRGRLDPLLWRAHRPGEPEWDGRTLGRGRPGWHIECAVIAASELGSRIDVLGGGSDLDFPHHEMSTSHVRGMTREDQPVRLTMHPGMLAYGGQKMSKSLGNLVFVHEMLARGINPAAIRLALMSRHYRDDWEWTGQELVRAETRLAMWREVILSGREQGSSTDTIGLIRQALADDLDTPKAITAIDHWVDTAPTAPQRHAFAGADLRRAIDALLGVQLY